MRSSERSQPALGEAVRELRRKRGATQEALARDAELTTATLSLIERGEANPTWDTLKKVSAALDVKISDLARLSEKFES